MCLFFCCRLIYHDKNEIISDSVIQMGMEKLAKLLMKNGNRLWNKCGLHRYLSSFVHGMDTCAGCLGLLHVVSVIKCFYANVLRWGWINHCHFDVRMNRFHMYDLYVLSILGSCIYVVGLFMWFVSVCVCLCCGMFLMCMHVFICLCVCAWWCHTIYLQIFFNFCIYFFRSPGRLWPKPKATSRNFFDRILYHHQRRFCHKIYIQTASFLGYCLREKKHFMIWYCFCCSFLSFYLCNACTFFLFVHLCSQMASEYLILCKNVC